MLSIRNAQLERMAQPEWEALLDLMCAHAARNFPALAALPDGALRAEVTGTLRRARQYGLRATRDVCTFLNLACEYGWRFDEMPKYAWMRASLLDEAAGAPPARLEWLVRRCIREEDIASYNQRLREAFAAGAVEPAQPNRYRTMGFGELEDSDAAIAGAAAWLAQQFQGVTAAGGPP